jgi:uncharacterized protein
MLFIFYYIIKNAIDINLLNHEYMSCALVTGAAKGIGRAIATELAKKGYKLLLVDIDNKGLQETAVTIGDLYGLPVETLHIDLSQQDAAERLKYWTRPFQDELTVVVNNAGYGLNGAFEQIPIQDQLNIIDVNIKAQLKIAHAFIPVLKQSGKAYLLNVGSTTCYQSVPYLSIYAASKAFIISFTRSLRYELKDSVISVSCLIPGSTDTDFVNRAKMGDHARRLANRYNMTPETVARIAVKGLFKRKSEIIPGFSNKLNAFLPKFFPKSFVERIAGNIYKPREEAPLPHSVLPQS